MKKTMLTVALAAMAVMMLRAQAQNLGMWNQYEEAILEYERVLAFELIDHNGRPRTDADFRGKIVLIYFGYTHCPDVCPTELLSVSMAVDMLGAEGSSAQPIFITIDPERDTPRVLSQYAGRFKADAKRWLFHCSWSFAISAVCNGQVSVQFV